jgi:hypothetical protein
LKSKPTKYPSKRSLQSASIDFLLGFRNMEPNTGLSLNCMASQPRESYSWALTFLLP